MTLRTKIAAGIGVLAISGGVVYGDVASQPAPVVIDVQLINPQQVVWNKPTTDAGWAEDVKEESLDVRSTAVLNQMLLAHEERLKDVQRTYFKYRDCPECIKYDITADNPNWNQKQLDDEFADLNTRYTWDYEKLVQSIERMEEELRLRKEGFVTVQGETQLLFGGRHDPKYIRHPID